MPARKKPVAVPDAELAVLKVMWKRGPATVREIADAVYPSGGASAHATVQKLLDRLQEKKCVARHGDGRPNRFRASVQRGELIRGKLQETAEKLCEGSFTPLLTELVDAKRLSPEDIEELRKLVDQAEKQRS